MDESKKINTSNFKIENNIISFNKTLLQISNISHVSAEPAPKKKFNYWAIVLMIIGIFFIGIDISRFLKNIGIFFIIAVIVYVVLLIKFNYENNDMYLNIFLNSGKVYCIYCHSMEFLEQVMEVIEYCINNHYIQEINVDFYRCKLSNAPIIIGNEN